MERFYKRNPPPISEGVFYYNEIFIIKNILWQTE